MTRKPTRFAIAACTAVSICVLFAMTGCIYVQQPQPVASAPPPPPPAQDVQLQQMLAPIALYPDPLLAILLPAASYPQEVQAAAQWLAANPAPTEAAIDSQPWDPSVRAMVHYPTVLQYMNANIDWTTALGAAFANDQAGVMATIQDLRAEAVSVGNLRTTPQQIVVQDESAIYIQPADPNVILVPAYDPVIVYARFTPITFGFGYPIGPWLGFGFDWRVHGFFVGSWRDGWIYDHDGWRRDPFFVRTGFHPWARDFHRGPVPFARGHYVTPREFHGREREFHAAPARHDIGRGPERHEERRDDRHDDRR